MRDPLATRLLARTVVIAVFVVAPPVPVVDPEEPGPA